MKKLLFILTVVLSGCSSVTTVTQKFPDAPNYSKCGELKSLDENSKLSDVAKTLNENYSSYYECAMKNDAWIEWYKSQKKIYEDVN